MSSWGRIDVVATAANPPAAPDIGGLLYSGKRHVISGEFESGKSWLLLAIAAGELAAGRGVVWVDADFMGAAATYERLHSLGVDDEVIERLFFFTQPASAATESDHVALLEFVTSTGARLVVGDALNAILSLYGLNPNATDEVEGLFRSFALPFQQGGAAVVFPDHVTKDKEARGRYAFGSERKVTGAEVHLGMRVIDPIRRGVRGRARVTVHRDRSGFLHQSPPGLFVLDSDPETGRCSWRFEADHSKGDEGEFRPTGLMEKVSTFLETRITDPPSRNQIEQGVEGKGEFVRLAIDVLVAEEYAVEIPGERGARLVKFLRPYREVDEWNEEPEA